MVILFAHIFWCSHSPKNFGSKAKLATKTMEITKRERKKKYTHMNYYNNNSGSNNKNNDKRKTF